MHSIKESNGKRFFGSINEPSVLEQNITDQVTITEYDKTTPKTLMLELTNNCNHSCVFCYHQYSKRKHSIMTLEFAKQIIDEAYKMGIRRLALYLLGEPFLYKDLGAVIRYAKQKNYEYIYLTTNGALAEKKRLMDVIEAGLHSIKFSIDAIDEKNYAIVHGRNDFNTVYKNLEWLYDYKVKNDLPIRVYVSSVLTKYNHDIDAIYKSIKKMCDELTIQTVQKHDI